MDKNYLTLIIIALIVVILIIVSIYSAYINKNTNLVKKYSKMYKEIVCLNNNFHFYDIDDKLSFNAQVNSLQKLQNFDFYTYMFNVFKSDYEKYSELINKAAYNEHVYNVYANEYIKIKNYMSEADFNKINGVKIKYKKFNIYERKIYADSKLKQPNSEVEIICKVEYTSPAGTNHYSRTCNYSLRDFKSMFRITIPKLQISSKKEEQNEIDKQLEKFERIKKRNDKRIEKLDSLLNNYKKLYSNKNLVTITENFIRRQRYIEEIERLAITFNGNDRPTFKTDDFADKKYNLIRFTLQTGYNYYKSLKGAFTHVNFMEDFEKININQPEIRELFDDSYDEYKKDYEMFKDVMTLKSNLLNQKIINTTELEAYYFLLSETQEKILKEEYNKYKDLYNFNDETDDKKFFDQLYDMGLSDEQMEYCIALQYHNKSQYTSFGLNLEDAKEFIEENIKLKKSKKYLDNLISNKSEKKNIADIDLMSGAEFENFVGDLFTKMGYSAEVTKTSGDQGIDVLARKGDTIIAIQAKCYSGVVGNHAIMEAVAGAKYYKANQCMVITNNFFTKSAKELAESNNVKLWDRNILKEKMEEYL